MLTDLYELTMFAGYLEEGMSDTPAVSLDLHPINNVSWSTLPRSSRL